MQFIVTRQVAIEADTVEQALEKTKPNEGETISLSVNPRPQQPGTGQVTSSTFQRTTTKPTPK